MSWPAGDGYPAGTLGWELFFGTGDGLGAQGWIGDPSTVVFPGTTSPTARPLDGPVDFTPGTIVQMLAPGIRQSDQLVMDSWNEPHPDIADRFVYEAQPGTSVRHRGWADQPQRRRVVPRGSDDGRVVSGRLPVAARHGRRPIACPRRRARVLASPSVVDLVDALPAERATCYEGQELTLGPAFAAKVDRGTPGSSRNVGLVVRLAMAPLRRGRATGLDGPILAGDLPVARRLPADGLPLTVTGHFGDPAGSLCARGRCPTACRPKC